MQFASIASGSSGNCLYTGNDDTHLLIDAGISKKRIEEGLNGFGVDPGDIDALLITHEHSDHIKGLGVMARKYHMPIYATRGTIREILKQRTLGRGRSFFVQRSPCRRVLPNRQSGDPSFFHTP